MVTTADKTGATLMQISAFSQYIFPFGNLIFPTIIWSLKRKESEFINENGKRIINFQLSLLLYFMILLIVSVPIILYNIFNGIDVMLLDDGHWVEEQFTVGRITGIAIAAIVSIILLAALKVIEFFLILYAAVKNSNGEVYKFPLTIKFIK
ncbi:DUF4870 domain-containing protein [Flavobacterium litorale]|uniref:DUF4870 domain-containing protein n=1 Tax=Flavobacterium litorale TaxID=2856519 RepID=A0ABX8VB13_9FLAO|nr:DUF4870 domain-containing protein [Flavobacterium litorale]QYJ68383.1 DUF4870 domain-containing protein [Flavobacterium litorale]